MDVSECLVNRCPEGIGCVLFIDLSLSKEVVKGVEQGAVQYILSYTRLL